MRRQQLVGITLAVALALIGVAVLAAGRPEADSPAELRAPLPSPGDENPEVEPTASGVAGVRVFLDPLTGEIRSRPDEGEAVDDPRRLSDRLNTYGGDLIQEALPQGGFKVDLRGRFQSAVVATIDPETDEVTIDCVSQPVVQEVGDER